MNERKSIVNFMINSTEMKKLFPNFSLIQERLVKKVEKETQGGEFPKEFSTLVMNRLTSGAWTLSDYKSFYCFFYKVGMDKAKYLYSTFLSMLSKEEEELLQSFSMLDSVYTLREDVTLLSDNVHIQGLMRAVTLLNAMLSYLQKIVSNCISMEDEVVDVFEQLQKDSLFQEGIVQIFDLEFSEIGAIPLFREVYEAVRSQAVTIVRQSLNRYLTDRQIKINQHLEHELHVAFLTKDNRWKTLH